MSPLLANAILLSLFLFSLAMILTLIRLFKGPSAQDRVLGRGRSGGGDLPDGDV